MTRIALGAWASGLTTCLTSPLVRKTMLSRGVLDHPNHRSSHTDPVPRGGGVAALAGVLASAIVTRPPSRRDIMAPLLLAGVGFADDHRGGLSPRTRLAAQAVIGLTCGRSVVGRAETAALVPAVVNVVNFMDGINGITATTMAVWGFHVATDDALPTESRWLGSVAAGASMGFLPWNAPNARLFLGDVGSYLFGGLAATALTGVRSPTVLARAGAPLLLYAADAAQALISGKRTGAPLFEAHRRHVYQRLVDEHGFSHVQVSLGHAAAAATLAVLARRLSPAPAAAAGSVVIAAYLAAPELVRRRRARRRAAA